LSVRVRNLAIVGSVAAGLVACTAEPRYPITPGEPMGPGGVSVAEPRYPIAESSAAPSPAAPPPVSQPAAAPSPADDGAPPRAAPLGQVETRPLPAPGEEASLPPPPPPPPPPAASSAPAYPPTTGEAGDLRGRQRAGLPLTRAAPPPALETPREVQVQPFENLYDVAERTRTPIRALIDANGLRPPYALTPGTVLRVPQPAVYTVVEGDTLFGVARRFSIDPRSLANLNDIPLETRVKPGQRLALPSLVHDKGPNPAARGSTPEGLEQTLAAAPPVSRSTIAGGVKTAAVTPKPAPEPPPRIETPAASDSEIASLGKGKFVWPIKGDILSTFGPKGPGQRNDGVNIAAEAGASVKAAAAGTVVYAGNSIPAFGNLVLVKHPGGWATLYGNLGKITVKNNAQVAQGQEVGVAGVSGAVDRPQVHFEIRYAPNPKDKAKPYDPASLLPGG
jgi:murein DD-endopeptidase MepM/ murein hydrolase activator NlpD